MAGLLVRGVAMAAAATLILVGKYVQGLARDPVMVRRPYPLTAAAGLFLTWIMLGLVGAIATVVAIHLLTPPPQINGDPLPRDFMSDPGVFAMGALVGVVLAFTGPYVTLPFMRRWRRFSGRHKSKQARSFLGLGQPVRGPAVRGGRIDAPSAGVSMEMPKEWYAFDMTAPGVLVAAEEMGTHAQEVVETVSQSPLDEATHVIHAFSGATRPSSTCDVVIVRGLLSTASTAYSSSVQRGREAVRRLDGWRSSPAVPMIGHESLRAGRTTTLRFECEVPGWRRPWHAVGYLLEDVEPPIYLEFRTRYEGTSRGVEARWRALADTLQLSASQGPP